VDIAQVLVFASIICFDEAWQFGAVFSALKNLYVIFVGDIQDRGAWLNYKLVQTLPILRQ
jgi:hypothetical protein